VEVVKQPLVIPFQSLLSLLYNDWPGWDLMFRWLYWSWIIQLWSCSNVNFGFVGIPLFESCWFFNILFNYRHLFKVWFFYCIEGLSNLIYPFLFHELILLLFFFIFFFKFLFLNLSSECSILELHFTTSVV